MASNTVPTPTFNAPGNIRASASLAAAASANFDLDYSAVFEGQIHVLNTPGGTIAAARGLQIDIFVRYGNGPATSPSPMATFFLPSLVASTAEALPIRLGPGKYNIKVTNLDAANAVTVEITGDTITSLTTT